MDRSPALNTPACKEDVPKIFTVKLPPDSRAQPDIPPGEYVVVACPKCGKKTYGVAGQKGKKCPVCRRQYTMPDVRSSPRFKTPEEACRFIQAEDAVSQAKGAAGRNGGPRPSSERHGRCGPAYSYGWGSISEIDDKGINIHKFLARLSFRATNILT